MSTQILLILTLPHDLLDWDTIRIFCIRWAALWGPQSGYFEAFDKSSGRLGEGCGRLPQASCSTWVRCERTWGFRVEGHYPKNGEAHGQELENEMETGISRFRA